MVNPPSPSDRPGDHWNRERGADETEAEALRPEILEFIADQSQNMAFLMTRRKDGREIMRPVSAFVEGWTVWTITQDVQPKTTHVKNDPVVGYLFVGQEGRADWQNRRWNPKIVWYQGRAELITDQDEIAKFFERREAAIGSGRSHPPEDTLYLMKVTPEYVRAEGWRGSHAIVYKDFDA